MAYVEKTIKDSAGADVAVLVWEAGRDEAADSAPVAIDTESKAALDAISAKLSATAATFGSKQTSATGATFVALDAAACIGVEIKNTRPTVSGLAPTNIEVRRGGSGATVCIAVGGADYFGGLTDASQLQIRRYDQSNTQVNVDYEARS